MDTPFAGRHLNALALCLLEVFGKQHAMVGALSARETSDLKEELPVRAVERSDVLDAEGPRHRPI